MLRAGWHAIMEIEVGEMPDNLKEIAKKAAENAGMEILGEIDYKFSPKGETIILGIKESHISFHTWPEYNYIACDIFTCGSRKSLNEAMISILKSLDPKHVYVKILERGL